MSLAEMRKEIQKKVEKLEENKLKAVSDFIEQIKSESSPRLSVIAHAMQVIELRKDILKKLAQ